jgi:predicted metal-binding protein
MHLIKMILVVSVVFFVSCNGSDSNKTVSEPEGQTEAVQQESVSVEPEAEQQNTEKTIQEKPTEREVPVDRKGTWGKADRFAFLDNCVKSAKTSMGDEKAIVYCSCVLEQVEGRYQTAEDALKLDVNEMMEMAKICMENL